MPICRPGVSRHVELRGPSKRLASVKFLAAIGQYSTSDDELIYLLCTFEDVVDLCISHPLLDQFLARVTQRSQELDRLLGDEGYGLTGFGLRHRRFEIVLHT